MMFFGNKYDAYFDKPRISDVSIVSTAVSVDYKAKLYLQMIERSSYQASKISTLFQSKSELKTAKEIWEFCRNNIKYQKDPNGQEYIRSPARTWADKKIGVDCEDYCIFISSILVNLQIQHSLKIVDYEGNGNYSHIYIVVKTKKGKQIVLDAVDDKYNKEIPYKKSKDFAVKFA